MITQDRVRELFDYQDGNLVRRITVQSRSKAGEIAGTISGDRIIISIDRRRYKLHRIIWFWHHGVFPIEVDHRDGDPMNNRIGNLRATDRLGNMKNVKKPITNTSGFKGVRFHKQRLKWTAQIVANGKQQYLGIFKTPEEAHEAYCVAARQLHGEFARFS